MNFNVCLATNRKDEDGRPVWRNCGNARVLPRGVIDIRAWTVFGEMHVGLYPVSTPTARGPSHVAYVTGDYTTWDMGVAYKNQAGGYNIVLDSPGGEWRLFLFPANVTVAAA